MSSLITKSTVKRLALDLARQRFAGTAFEGRYTRVSSDLLDAAESHMRQWLADRIANMPTVGKTIQ